MFATGRLEGQLGRRRRRHRRRVGVPVSSGGAHRQAGVSGRAGRKPGEFLAAGAAFTTLPFPRNLRMGPKARVLHYARLEMLAGDKRPSLVDPFLIMFNPLRQVSISGSVLKLRRKL